MAGDRLDIVANRLGFLVVSGLERRFQPAIVLQQSACGCFAVADDPQHLVLKPFIQVAEIDPPAGRLFGDPPGQIRRFFAPVGSQRAAIHVGHRTTKGLSSDPLQRDVKLRTKPVEPDPPLGEVAGDLGQVAPQQGPAGLPRLEKHHPETFRQAGREDQIGGGEVFGERQSAGRADLEYAWQVQLGGQPFPALVDRHLGRIQRRQSQPQHHVRRAQPTVEQCFADVFPPDGTDRVKYETVVFLHREPLGQPPPGVRFRQQAVHGGHRIGEPVQSLPGHARGEQDPFVTAVEHRIMDVGGLRVRPGRRLLDPPVVARPKILGEIVDLQEHRVSRFGQPRNHGRQVAVLAQCVVVEVKQGLPGAELQPVQRRGQLPVQFIRIAFLAGLQLIVVIECRDLFERESDRA